MIEAEQGVIGAILIDNDSLFHVINKLKPEMFASEFYRDCYSESLALYDRGQQINPVTLSQRLENGNIDVQTIIQKLALCIVNIPTSVVIKGYADTIIQEYKSRMASQLFQRISLLPKDIDTSISESIARLEELQSGQVQRSKSMKQIVEENKGNYFNEKHIRNAILTGFDKMDDCLGSLEGGEIIVIGARPAVGKSAFVTQIIANLALKGLRIGYFNLEMRESQVYERLVARISNLSLMRIKKAIHFLGDEEMKFNKGNDELSKLDIIVSTGGKKVSDIKSESRHQNFDVIVVDYLQLIEADKNRGANRTAEVGDISRAMKSLAMELNVPIILLSQLNRLSEGKDTKEPTMAELRESGAIEQDASAIFLLWNLSDDDRSLKGCKGDKVRQGEAGKKWALKFHGDSMTFEEIEQPISEIVKELRNGATIGFIDDDRDSPFD